MNINAYKEINIYSNLLNLKEEWREAQKLGYVHRPFSDVERNPFELVQWRNLMVKHATMLQNEIDRIRD